MPKRKGESDNQLEDEFKRSLGGERYAQRQRQRQRPIRSRNALAKMLLQAYVALGEPVFAQAFLTLAIYGCSGNRAPAKRLKKIGNLLATELALRGLMTEIDWQRANGGSRSMRRMMGLVVAAGYVDGPEFGSALKRLQRAWKERRRSDFPWWGDSGREVLIGEIEQIVDTEAATKVRLAHTTWLPDDRHIRRALSSPDIAGQFIVLGFRDRRPPTAELDEARKLIASLKPAPGAGGIAYRPRDAPPKPLPQWASKRARKHTGVR